jgi:hypothetical protein
VADLGLDYTLWATDPTGYHLTNVILHAANAVAFFFVIRGLLGPTANTAAAAGALFFAIHPLRVESVAWVSERKDVLSGLFYLLAVLAYLRLRTASGRARFRWLVASLGCFLLGLLAKPWGMALPLALLALDGYPLRRFATEEPRSVLVEKLPYALLSVGALLLTVHVARPVEGMRSLAEHGIAARLAQAAYGLCFYVWKTIVPLGLSPLYVLEPHLDPARPRYVAAVVAVLGVTGTLLALRRPRWALSACVVYVALVSPMLGFVQTGPQIAADRFTYLPCLPWAVVLAAAVHRVGIRAAAPVALTLAVLGVLTFRQTQVWTDSRSLWEHALRLDPENYVAHLNLGTVHTDDTQAVADFTAAIRLRPGLAMAWYNRGNRRRQLGDLDGAIADLTEAIRLKPRIRRRGTTADGPGPRRATGRGRCVTTRAPCRSCRPAGRAVATSRPTWPSPALASGVPDRKRATTARRATRSSASPC